MKRFHVEEEAESRHPSKAVRASDRIEVLWMILYKINFSLLSWCSHGR
jgi:hypothetical protein